MKYLVFLILLALTLAACDVQPTALNETETVTSDFAVLSKTTSATGDACSVAASKASEAARRYLVSVNQVRACTEPYCDEPLQGAEGVYTSLHAAHEAMVSACTTPNESCNGIDDDLDGDIDEGLPYCINGTNAPHTTGDGERCLEGWYDNDEDPVNGCEVVDCGICRVLETCEGACS